MDIFRVSFIGHRVVDEYRQVEEELDEVIELLHRKYGFIEFNVGRNGEFDDLATQAVRRFRREWEEWCEIGKGRDFFDYDGRVDYIFTNPPWSRICEFLFHSIKVADEIYFLKDDERKQDLIRCGTTWERATE